MAINSNQKQKKFLRNYCRSVLLIASTLTVCCGSASGAQSEFSAPRYLLATSNEQAIWTNPFTYNRVYLDSSWRIATKFAGDRTTSLIDDAAISSQLGVLSSYVSESLKDYVDYILRNGGEGEFLFSHSEYLYYKGGLVWFASGVMANKPDRAFIITLKKDGNYVRQMIGTYPSNKKLPPQLNHLNSQILDSFSK